jgi:hypothetical protein
MKEKKKKKKISPPLIKTKINEKNIFNMLKLNVKIMKEI